MSNYMEYSSFCAKIEENIKEYFGDDYNVSTTNVRKNNGIVLTGISVGKKTVNISPTIYLENFYHRYKKGEVYASIMQDLISVIESHQTEHKLNIDFFKDYKNISGNIFYKLINADMNKELLLEVPHRKYLDMALVYYYLVDESFVSQEWNADEVMASILITNNHMVALGISEEDLYLSASKNTPVKLTSSIKNITEVLTDIMVERIVKEKCDEIDFDEELLRNEARMMLGFDFDETDIHMFVLSNKYKRYGASTILYDNLLEEFAKSYDSNLYVLPSSIHEGATCNVA